MFPFALIKNVSKPVHLSFFGGTVLWITALAGGEPLKPLSRAGRDSEIRGGRSFLSSQFFPHARTEIKHVL